MCVCVFLKYLCTQVCFSQHIQYSLRESIQDSGMVEIARQSQKWIWDDLYGYGMVFTQRYEECHSSKDCVGCFKLYDASSTYLWSWATFALLPKQSCWSPSALSSPDFSNIHHSLPFCMSYSGLSLYQQVFSIVILLAKLILSQNTKARWISPRLSNLRAQVGCVKNVYKNVISRTCEVQGNLINQEMPPW